MRKLLFVVLAATASPGLAASYDVGVTGVGPGQTSNVSFNGFNASLGTLTSVVFSLSGNTTYSIQLSGTNGGIPPSGPVTYDFTTGAFLYAQPSGNIPFNVQPFLQEKGAASTTAVTGLFQASVSGPSQLTTITDPGTLAAFNNTTFSGYVSVGNPTANVLTVNGVGASLLGATINILSKSVTGTVTYNYTERGAAVPEPASWALMLAGFGLVGAAARSTRGRPRAGGVSA